MPTSQLKPLHDCLSATHIDVSSIWEHMGVINEDVSPICARTGNCEMVPNGPLDRSLKLWVEHALGMPGTSSLPPGLSDPDVHHGTCATHVP